MRQSIGPLYQAMQELLPLVDADSAAFELFQVLSTYVQYCTEEHQHVVGASVTVVH